MSASYELLETLQADILAVLLATPALANCAIIADDDGDTESKVTKALAGTVKNRAGKYGLAVIVLAPQVTSAEANLPGPPLLVQVDVQTLEHVQTNRGPSGSGLRSSHAAMIALNTLHLYQFGAHVLYADKAPIEPLPATSGLVSHSISLYLRAGGIAVAEKPSQVQAAVVTGPALVVGGTAPVIPTLYPAGSKNGWPYYSANGLDDALPQPQCYRLGTQWFIDDGGDAAWSSAANSAATPDLAGGWTLEPGTATGTPAVTLIPPGDGIVVTGTLTTDGSTPLVFPEDIPSAGTANGRPTYYIVTGAGEFGAIWKTVANPFTGSGDFTGWFLQEDVDGVTWASTADVATPDLVPAGAWHASTNPLAWRPVSPATGTPVVAASAASTITLTCASPSSSIRYTTDGSYPSPAKTLYTGPLALPTAGTVMRAAAYVTGMPPSDILEFTVTE